MSSERRGTYRVRGTERHGEIIGYEAYPGKPEVYTIREDGTGRIHRVRPSQMRQPENEADDDMNAAFPEYAFIPR